MCELMLSIKIFSLINQVTNKLRRIPKRFQDYTPAYPFLGPKEIETGKGVGESDELVQGRTTRAQDRQRQAYPFLTEPQRGDYKGVGLRAKQQRIDP